MNIAMGMSLKYMWNLMNTIQFLIYLPMWRLNIPDNALTVLNSLNSIALGKFIPYEFITSPLKNLLGEDDAEST